MSFKDNSDDVLIDNNVNISSIDIVNPDKTVQEEKQEEKQEEMTEVNQDDIQLQPVVYNDSDKINIQLGDILFINDVDNEILDNQTFYVNYLNNKKIMIINIETLKEGQLNINENNTLNNNTITNIIIVSRHKSPSFAIQNNLIPGKKINLYFNQDDTLVISGEITNLEEDMIEVTTSKKDVLYINFKYSGMPENLNLNKIKIVPNTKSIDSEKELNIEEDNVENMNLNYELKDNDVGNKINKDIKQADDIIFGDNEYDEMTVNKDVSFKLQRYSILEQTTDLLNDIVSMLPNNKRNHKSINNIHTMIARYKELREEYSVYDTNSTIVGMKKADPYDIPLMNYFNNFSNPMYWILPVVKQKHKLYDVSITDAYPDISIYNSSTEWKELLDSQSFYKSNNNSSIQSNYYLFYNEIYYEFNDRILNDTFNDDVLLRKTINNNITAMVDNLNQLKSTRVSNNMLKSNQYNHSTFVTGLSRLNNVDRNHPNIYSREPMTNNEELNITGFITLPKQIIEFSRINLPNTNMLERANLNTHFVRYHKIFNKKMSIENNLIDLNNINNNDDSKEKKSSKTLFNSITYHKLAFNHTSQSLLDDNAYKLFIRHIIPTTKILFNAFKSHISGKLSFVDALNCLEPFQIYHDNITFTQYQNIRQFIDNEISKKSASIKNKMYFLNKLQNVSQTPSTINKTNMNLLVDTNDNIPVKYGLKKEITDDNKEIQNDYRKYLNNDEMDSDVIQKTDSELYKDVLFYDNGCLLTASLSLDNNILIYPDNMTPLFSNDKEQINDNDENTKTCKNIIIAKRYTSVKELEEDNNLFLIFDKDYDKTNYAYLNKYDEELKTIESDKLIDFLITKLEKDKNLKPDVALELASTMLNGYKEVINGHYAVVDGGINADESSTDNYEYYVRNNNVWILDEKIKNINTLNSDILCDVEKDCININTKIDLTNELNNKCISEKNYKDKLKKDLLKNIIDEFDKKYYVSKEENELNMKESYQYHIENFDKYLKIKKHDKLKYNNEKYKIIIETEGEDSSDLIVSPYLKLLNLILGQSDFVKRNYDIIRFVKEFTRTSNDHNENEFEHWFYCKSTNTELLPSFQHDMALAYTIDPDNYMKKVYQIISENDGAISDDGAYYIDKNTSRNIIKIDFDIDEGYSDGYKVNTRAIMEDSIGDSLVFNSNNAILSYEVQEMNVISNVVNSLSVAMGINIESQKEFIINNVMLTMKNSVESESQYKAMVRSMIERGKKIKQTYKEHYNTALMYFTLGMYLISIQSVVPPLKTRKTHPGCKKSFTGFPIDGDGDDSALNYLACVVYDIKTSTPPWNVLKKKEDSIANKIKASVENLLINEDVKRRIDERREYDYLNPDNNIPDVHSIENWSSFLPPLIKLDLKDVSTVSDIFKKELTKNLKEGSIQQHEQILVIRSKIIYFSLLIQQQINKIVSKKPHTLFTSNNDPYIENSCCYDNTTDTVLDYFIKEDKVIKQYHKNIGYLSDILQDIKQFSSASIFYSIENTKNIHPSVIHEYAESTIYGAFIKFCKFRSLSPIPTPLLPMCASKPDLITNNKNLFQIINQIKGKDIQYTNKQFLNLMQILSKHNIVESFFNFNKTSRTSKFEGVLLANYYGQSESKNNNEDSQSPSSLYNDLANKLINIINLHSADKDDSMSDETIELNGFLMENIELMKESIIEFVKDNNNSNITTSKLRSFEKTISDISKWKCCSFGYDNNVTNLKDRSQLFNVINFYKNVIFNIVNVIPSRILHKKSLKEIKIQPYHGLSKTHIDKLNDYASKYYSDLEPFFEINSIHLILKEIQLKTANILKIVQLLPTFQTNKRSAYPLINEETSFMIHEFILLNIFKEMIYLNYDNKMIQENIVTNYSDNELLGGVQMTLRKDLSYYFVEVANLIKKEKHNINIDYSDIENTIFKLKEGEKYRITDRLKNMKSNKSTKEINEEREVEKILKVNKLGVWNKGLQKGLTSYVQETFDEEREFRDAMSRIEKQALSENPEANQEQLYNLVHDHLDGIDEDLNEQDEEYAMENINEDGEIDYEYDN